MAEHHEPAADGDGRVEAAVHSFLEAQDRGTPLDPETWLTRHPEEIRQELQAVLIGLSLVGRKRPTAHAVCGRSIPDRLPDFSAYRGLTYLASGGMGAVYKGYDTSLGRVIALKVMHADLVANTDLVERFTAEAQVVSQLQHPNIAPLHELGVMRGSPPRPYFTMKLIEGHTLTAKIEEYHAARTDAGRDALVRHFIAVCNAVDYAHGRGILHRDLKPSNIMVGRYGEVQVMDWGLSKVLPPQGSPLPIEPTGQVYTSRSDGGVLVTEAGIVRGTLAYMSVEQATGGDVGAASDVFGLGAILCELLTGIPAYTGSSRDEVWRKAREGDVTGAATRLDSTGEAPELVALAKRCLAREPEHRPQTAGAVAANVGEYLADAQRRLRQAELERAQAEVRVAEERKRRGVQLSLIATAITLTAVVVGTGAWLRLEAAKTTQAKRDAAAEVLGRLQPAVQEAELLRDRGQPREALVAAHRASAVAQDDRIEPHHREAITELVRSLEEGVAQGERDQALLVRTLEVVGLNETVLATREAISGSAGFEARLAAAFRQYGVDLAEGDAEVAIAQLQRRPPLVRRDIASAVDLWAFGERTAGRRAATWQRLIRVARAIDPDPERDALRRILTAQQVLPQVDTMLSPLTRLIPESDHNRLIEIATRADLSVMPAHTTQLLSIALLTVREYDHAVKLLRAAAHARPENPSLHVWLATVLILQSPSRWQEAIVPLQSARALRPDLGGSLAVLLARAGRQEEALQVCRDLTRRLPTSPWPPAYESLVHILDRKFSLAADAAGRSMRADAHNVLAINGLAISNFRQRRYESAEVAARESVRLAPELGLSHAVLGTVLLHRRKYGEAEAALRAATRLQPNLALAYALQAQLMLKTARAKEAEAFGRSALQLEPDEAEFVSNLAIILAERQKFVEAEELARKAFRLQPKVPEVLAAHGYILTLCKRPAEGEAACLQAIRIDPELAIAHNNLAAACAAQKKYLEGEKAAREAIRLDPDLAPAHGNLGGILTLLERPQEGEQACRRAVALDAKMAVAHANLALALIGLKRPGDAEAAAREAVRLDPESVFGHANLANALFKLGRYGQAEAASRSAVKIAPDNGLVRSNLALSLVRQRKLLEAEEHARRAVEQDPTEAVVHLQLGDVLEVCGKLDAAADAYSSAARLKPSDAGIHVAVGGVRRMQKRWDEMIAAYQRAVAVAPADPSLRFILAHGLQLRGQPAAAVVEFRKAVELKPDDVTYREALGGCLDELGHKSESWRVRQEASTLIPKTAKDCHALGKIFTRFRLPRRAEEVYREAVRLAPADLTGYTALAKVLREGGRIDEAGQVLHRGAELECRNELALVELGQEFQSTKNHRAAIAAFKRAVQLIGDEESEDKNETKGWAYTGLGQSFREVAEPEAAVDAFRNAVKAVPSDCTAHVELADALVNAGRPDEAVRACEEAIRAKPDFAPAYRSLGISFVRLHRYTEAADAFRKLTTLRPKDASGHEGLGAALLAWGEYKAALEPLQHAVRLNPDSSHPRALLALSHWQLSRRPEAETHLREAAALKPCSFIVPWLESAIKLAKNDLPAGEKAANTAFEECPKDDVFRGMIREDVTRLGSMRKVADKFDLIAAAAGGAIPDDRREALALADLAAATNHYTAAVRLYKVALDGSQPDHPVEQASSLARAAQAAIKAADESSAVDDREGAALRTTAREWLAEAAKLLQAIPPNTPAMVRASARRTLRGWQLGEQWNRVRADFTNSSMSRPEHVAWKKVWAEVDKAIEVVAKLR